MAVLTPSIFTVYHIKVTRFWFHHSIPKIECYCGNEQQNLTFYRLRDSKVVFGLCRQW